jgi:hypothetical protein
VRYNFLKIARLSPWARYLKATNLAFFYLQLTSVFATQRISILPLSSEMAGHWPISLEATWQRSDRYHNSFLVPQDDILDAVVENSKVQGLPDIAVSTAQAKFLNLLAKTCGAKRILEVGTLGG